MTSRDPAPAPAGAGGWSRPVALVVAVAYFMENMDATILSTATASIARDFRVAPADIGIAVTAYLVAVAAFIPVGAWLAARWGARRVFLIAIVLFTLASIACALSPDVALLASARVVQGIAGSMMVPIGRLLVLHRTDKSELVRAIAYLTWPALVAPIIAPLVGGVLAEYAGWPWVFLVNVPIGIALLVAAARVVPRGDTLVRRPLDGPGLVLVVSAIVAVVLGFELVAAPARTLLGVALLLAAVALGYAATRWFRVREHPLLELSTLRIATFRVSNFGGSVYRGVVSAAPFLFPLLLQDGFGWTPVQAGLTLMWVFVGNLGIKPLTTPLMRRFPLVPIAVVASLGLAATFGAAALLRPDTSPVLIAAVFLLSGVFRSVGFTAYNTLQFADVPAERIGAANAIASITSQLAVGLGVAVSAVVLRLASDVPTASAGALGGYRIALAVMAALGVLSVLDALALPRGAGDAVRRTKAARPG